MTDRSTPRRRWPRLVPPAAALIACSCNPLLPTDDRARSDASTPPTPQPIADPNGGDRGGAGGLTLFYPFASRTGHPVTDTPAGHAGRTQNENWDIDCALNDRVLSTVSGVVSSYETGRSQGERNYGNRVCVTTADRVTVCHNHLASVASAILSTRSCYVRAGDEIGRCGNTGYVIPLGGGDGTHLDVYAVNAAGNVSLSSPAVWRDAPSIPGASDCRAPTLHLDAPNGGQTLPFGRDYVVRWTGADVRGLLRVELLQGDAPVPPPMSTTAPASGSLVFNPSSSLTPGDYRICVSGEAGTLLDCSDATFRIAAESTPVPAPRLELLSPTPGATWTAGSTYPVRWSSTGIDGTFRVVVRHGGLQRFTVDDRAPLNGERAVTVFSDWTPQDSLWEICVTNDQRFACAGITVSGSAPTPPPAPCASDARVGASCLAGVGACGAMGVWVCDAGSVRCNAAPRAPSPEVCGNDIDEDCNGVATPCATPCAGDARVGTPCALGVGSCQRTGAWRCEMGAVRCDAVAGPSAPESCNGVDDDCDGVVDDGCACAPGVTQICYTGPSGTVGRGVCRAGRQTCEATAGGSAWGPCAGQVAPAAETCNGLDDDCNGTVDDANPGGGASCTTTQPGRCAPGVRVCTSGSLTCAATQTPVAESCNGVDDNCDGVVDDGCACAPSATQTCYTGPSGTVGRGACRAGRQTCEATAGGSAWGPCAGQVTPAAETCNGLDDDCDGTVDFDAEGLGASCATGQLGVCSQGRRVCVAGVSSCAPARSPEAETCNGLDDDCDGVGDDGCACALGATQSCYAGPSGTRGVGACRAGTQACAASPGGGSAWGACVGQVTPTAETCNGLDDNCDGSIDEAPAGVGASCATTLPGACRVGSLTCIRGGIVCQGPTPLTESCNGVDDDCDGVVDDGCACAPGVTQICYTGPSGTVGRGVCRAGRQTCEATAGGSAWGPCAGQVAPAAETCNGLDDDCNGAVDDGCGAGEGPNQICDGGLEDFSDVLAPDGWRDGCWAMWWDIALRASPSSCARVSGLSPQGSAHVECDVRSSSAAWWQALFVTEALSVQDGLRYRVRFRARSTSPRWMHVAAQHTNGTPYGLDRDVYLTADWQRFTLDFTAVVPSGRDDRTKLAFGLVSTVSSTVSFDEIEFVQVR